MPPASSASATESKAQPPSPIIASFWLYAISAVFSLVGGIWVFSDKQRVADVLHKDSPSLTTAQLHDKANDVAAVALGAAVIGFLLYLFFAAKLKAGRNWARIVLTVLVVIDTILLATNDGTMRLEYAGIALSVVATILAYLSASNAYIRATKLRR
jgi:hypothetical protein